MKMRHELLFALAVLTLLSCGTPAPTPVFVDGNLGQAAPDLQRLERSGFSLAWMRPDVSFAGYDRVHLVYPDVRYRTTPRYSSRAAFGADNYSLSEGFTMEFMSALEQSFRNELAAAGAWRPAAEPNAYEAEQTLVIRVSLIDLIVHVPLELLAGDTEAWVDSIGAVTVVIDLYDVPTQHIIARFADRRFVAPRSGRAIRANPGASLYESRQIFSLWARNLRLALEALETAKGTTVSRATPAPDPIAN